MPLRPLRRRRKQLRNSTAGSNAIYLWTKGNDRKLKHCGILPVDRPTSFNYRYTMTKLARNFVILLIAIFAASTVVHSAAAARADIAMAMPSVETATVGQSCPKCGHDSVMAASCDLACTMSFSAILIDPVMPATQVGSGRIALANSAEAVGQGSPPHLSPPRTTILI